MSLTKSLLISSAMLLMTTLSACTSQTPVTADPNNPNLNKVKFSEVTDASAQTTDFDTGLLSSSLAVGLGQDFLTINAAPSSAAQNRLLTITLRTQPNQIKVGATFPLGAEDKTGVVNATYFQTSSILLTHAFRAKSGTLTIDRIGGTITATTVDFSIKDAKMEPTKPELGTGSFVLNFQGQPARP